MKFNIPGFRFKIPGGNWYIIFSLASFAIIPLCIAPVISSTIIYPDHPLPGHTGGFGEPSCFSCHFEFDVNTGEGILNIKGLPPVYEPGTTYELSVVLRHNDMRVAGFQLSARDTNGRQAGDFDVTQSRTIISELEEVQYLHHTFEGTSLTAPRESMWIFSWNSPPIPGTVLFHLSAVAGNDDRSEFGDYVYSIHEELESTQSR